jgi:hypothetical protein
MMQIVDNPARVPAIISLSEQTRRRSAWKLAAAAVAENLGGISRTLPVEAYGIFDSSQGPI